MKTIKGKFEIRPTPLPADEGTRRSELKRNATPPPQVIVPKY